ncbi:MAG: SGNH/GDSL hydrolase family protein [Spirochaetaceae bacterium]|nr:SGNH/GDSL hydrolase family protein [Spirochaetaceae bacterium]MCF7939330.1 SGNH/GDSL hydrolase family protein [Spirochaetales bacterium]
MKQILCYGDSNTWGYTPVTGIRYSEDTRWPGVLASLLGPNYRIIEEGLNGRTTVFEDPLQEGRNGKTYLLPCLLSHRPFDVVILMLGTNDMKQRYGVPAEDIARGAGVLAEIILNSGAGPDNTAPKLILLSPPGLGKLTAFGPMFTGASEKSLHMGPAFREVAQEIGCSFVDIGGQVKAGNQDGIHLDPEGHRRVAELVAKALTAPPV